MKNRVVFVFSIQSVSDVITNSSSELFVFEGNSKKDVIEILDTMYPTWKDEYIEPSEVGEFDDEGIVDFLRFTHKLRSFDEHMISNYSFLTLKKNKTLECCKLAKQFKLKPEEAYTNWDILGTDDSYENSIPKPSEELIKRFREYAKKNKIVILCSIDENPDYHYQDLLMEIADRFCLE